MNLFTQKVTVTRFVSDGVLDEFGHETTGATETIYEDYACRVYFRNLGAVAVGKESERGANIVKIPNMLGMNAGVSLLRDDVATVAGTSYRVIAGGDVLSKSTPHHSEWQIEEVV